MAKTNFKASISAIVGACTMLGYLVVNENSYGYSSAYDEKVIIAMKFLYDITIPYVVGFVVCFILMRIWQAFSKKTFTNAKTKFFAFCENLYK